MYVELHARSAFSFLEGASLPELLMARCCPTGYARDGIARPQWFVRCAAFSHRRRSGPGRGHILERRLRCAMPESECARPGCPSLPASALALLAETQSGYQNLCRLITRYKLREAHKAEGAALLADVAEFAEGLVCLTGGDEGPLAAALARGGYDEALREVERLMHIFGARNVYVELQRHFDREEEHRNQAAVRIARHVASASAGHQWRELRHSL